MVDPSAAYNSLLRIREMKDQENKWIDDMIEAQKAIVQLNQPGVQILMNHLVVIKTILETQDSIITMLMRHREETDDAIDRLKERLGM